MTTATKNNAATAIQLTIVAMALYGLSLTLPPGALTVPRPEESTVVVPSVFLDARFADTIHQLNRETVIPIEILSRMIERESRWEEGLISGPNYNGSRDYGLMQLNSKYLRYFAWKFNEGQEFDPFDPADNLRIGMRYLAWLYRHTGSWYDAVAAYNAGLSNVRAGSISDTTKAYLWFVFQDCPEMMRERSI